MMSSEVSAGVSAKELLQVSRHFGQGNDAVCACGVAACSNCRCQRFHILVFDGLAVWLVQAHSKLDQISLGPEP